MEEDVMPMAGEEIADAKPQSPFDQLAENELQQQLESGDTIYADLLEQQKGYFSEQKKALQTTTLLTALAQLPEGIDPNYGMTLNSINTARQTLEASGERALRQQLAYNRLQRQLQQFNKLGQDAISSADPELAQSFYTAYAKIQQEYDRRDEKIALEQAAVEKIQNMAMSDPVQARVLLDQLEYGNAERTKADFNAKLLVLRQRAEELDEEYQKSGWGRWLINMVLNAVPTNFNFQRTGVIGTAGFFDLFRVGSRQRDESQAMWQMAQRMSLKEFGEWAGPDGELMQSIRDNATSIFDMIDDPGAAVEIMDSLITTDDSTKTWNNVWGGVEIASAMPWNTMLKSTTKLIKGMGDAKSATRNLDNFLREAERVGPEEAARRTGVNPEEVVDELSVSAINPGRTDIPLTEMTETYIRAVDEAAEELFNTPEFGKFFTQEELQAHIQGRIDEIQRVIGSPVKNVGVKTVTLTGGQKVKRLVFDIGKKDGHGFANEGAALRGLRATGFTGETVAETVERTVPVRPKSKVERIGEQEIEADEDIAQIKELNRDITGAYKYRITTPDGEEVESTILVYNDGFGTIDITGDAINKLGASEVRNIAGQIADEIPNLKALSGVRTTGARGKLSGEGDFDFPIPVVNVENLRGRTRTVRDSSGQWFARIEVDMPEAGWLTGKLQPDQMGLITKMLGRWIGSAARTTDPTLRGMALEGGSYINRAAHEINETILGEFRKLGKVNREVLGALARRSAIEEKWYTNNEIHSLVERQFGRRATDAEIEGYRLFKLYDDIDWRLRNTAMYLQKLNEGYSTVKFTAKWGEEFNNLDVKVNFDMTRPPTQRVYDVSRNKHYVHGVNPLDTKTLTTMKNNGYVMLEVPEGFLDPRGIHVNHLLIRKTDIEISPLKLDQLAYAEGGHRMYTSRYIVKQGRSGVQADTGAKFLKAPAAFRMADNLAEGNKWTEVMNRARLAVKENPGISAEELNEQIFKQDKAFPTGEEFLEGVTDGTYDLEHAFETVFDRDLPSMYRQSGPDVERMFNEDELGVNSYYRTTGRMYTGRKGEVLRNTKGEVADILDPYDTLSKSLSQVTRMNGLHHYKLNAMERFRRTYAEFMDTDPTSMSPVDFLLHSKVKPSTPFDVRQQIEAQREAIQNVLRFETELDRSKRQFYQTMAEGFLGDGDSWMRKAAHDAVWWWKDNNPVSALRGLAFDSKLGMWNPAQLLIQASTLFSATALSPKYGWQGMKGIYPMHLYILKGGSENVLDTLVKRGLHDSMGFRDAEDFKDFARHAYKHGFMQMDGNHIMINNYGPNAHFGSFAEKQGRLREQGRVFFYTSEIWNRLVAYRIAWGEAADKGIRITDPQFNATILRLADDYSMNMTRESSAWWQGGRGTASDAMSLPTQFWAYNARMMEAMFGKRFTGAQRARLIAFNAAIAGSAGVPGASMVSEWLKDSQGADYDIDTIQGWIDRGIIDGINYQLTGNDILIGERIGTGSWITETARAIFGTSEYGEKSLVEMAGGATYTISAKTSKTLWNLAKYAAMESSEPNAGDITKENLIAVLREISTFSNMNKAMLIHQYGIYRTNSGTQAVSDLPSSNAIYAALSFAPAKSKETSYLMSWNKNREENLKEIATKLRNWRQEAMVTNDYEKYWRKAQIVITMVPVQDRQKLLVQSRAIDEDSFYKYVEKKVSEEQMTDDAMEGLE